jgi:hypothetical protein
VNDPADIAIRQMQARVAGTIFGPGGRPLAKAVVEDRTVTYAKDGESYTADPIKILMSAARMQRDGASLRTIRAELDLKNVPDATLERALKRGREWLDIAIAKGEEPAESKNVVAYEMLDEQEEIVAVLELPSSVGSTGPTGPTGTPAVEAPSVFVPGPEPYRQAKPKGYKSQRRAHKRVANESRKRNRRAR